MPIYEYKCLRHKVFELYVSLPNDNDFIKCPHCLEETVNINRIVDVEFCFEAERLFSLTVMRPDKYWAGQMLNGVYVTSEKEAKELTKNLVPASIDNLEYAAKRRSELKKEREIKRDKEVESFISNELAGVTVDPDYNHIVEKTLQKQKKYTEVSACFEETQTEK